MPLPVHALLLDIAPDVPRIYNLPESLVAAIVAVLVATAAVLLVLRARRRK